MLHIRIDKITGLNSPFVVHRRPDWSRVVKWLWPSAADHRQRRWSPPQGILFTARSFHKVLPSTSQQVVSVRGSCKTFTACCLLLNGAFFILIPLLISGVPFQVHRTQWQPFIFLYHYIRTSLSGWMWCRFPHLSPLSCNWKSYTNWIGRRNLLPRSPGHWSSICP